MENLENYSWSFYIENDKIIKIVDHEPDDKNIHRFECLEILFDGCDMDELKGRVSIDTIKSESELVYNKLLTGSKLKDLR